VKVIDSMTYRVDGAGYLESGFTHVFIVSAEGGTPRQLTDGDFNDDGPLSFTPDGRQLVFSANRGADWERDPAEQRSVQRGRRDAEVDQPHLAPGARQFARGFARRQTDCVPGLRRPLPGLPGHAIST
jgi:hypothetical protein